LAVLVVSKFNWLGLERNSISDACNNELSIVSKHRIFWLCGWRIYFHQFNVITVSKTVEELILEWKETNPITTGNLGLSQFDLIDIVASKCHAAFQIGMQFLSHLLIPNENFVRVFSTVV